jgi:hypothetical protein
MVTIEDGSSPSSQFGGTERHGDLPGAPVESTVSESYFSPDGRNTASVGATRTGMSFFQAELEQQLIRMGGSVRVVNVGAAVPLSVARK